MLTAEVCDRSSPHPVISFCDINSLETHSKVTWFARPLPLPRAYVGRHRLPNRGSHHSKLSHPCVTLVYAASQAAVGQSSITVDAHQQLRLTRPVEWSVKAPASPSRRKRVRNLVSPSLNEAAVSIFVSCVACAALQRQACCNALMWQDPDDRRQQCDTCYVSDGRDPRPYNSHLRCCIQQHVAWLL